MHKRFFCPICFIKIKCILFNFPIICNQTFCITPLCATFFSLICRKIEHVPHKAAPEIRSFLYCLKHFFVIIRLVLFRIILTFRSIRMILNIGICAIFRNSHAHIRIFFMERVHPRSAVLYFSCIPSHINIIGR